MKIDIQYQKHSDVDAPCIAKTEVMGEDLLAVGKTWDEAKSRLLAKVQSWLNASVPAPESVEVASKDEEMDTEMMPWVDQLDTKLAEIGVTSRDIEPGKV